MSVFNPHDSSAGIIQGYDDFDKSLTFEQVNSYSEARTKRRKQILVLPMVNNGSSKSYTNYVCNSDTY